MAMWRLQSKPHVKHSRRCGLTHPEKVGESNFKIGTNSRDIMLVETSMICDCNHLH